MILIRKKPASQQGDFALVGKQVCNYFMIH